MKKKQLQWQQKEERSNMELFLEHKQHHLFSLYGIRIFMNKGRKQYLLHF